MIEIEQTGIYLSVKQGFLTVKQEERETKFPLSNIDCLILNSYGASVSNQLLIRLCELNIPVLICGKNAVPIGILLSAQENVFRKTHIAAQLNASVALLENIWKAIVQAKLINQAALLKAQNCKFNDIALLAEKVTAGDKGNAEAVAARVYWQRLFGKNFRRKFEQPGINAFLNYSYALLRAAFCRQIAASGLLPESGIHHHNKMNPFCLADDLMEPYRPFADQVVKELDLAPDAELTPAYKRQLIALFDKIVYLKGENRHLQFCLQDSVESAMNSFLKKRCELQYPVFAEQKT